MNRALWVLDTGALMAYAHGVEQVGQAVVDAAEMGAVVAIPLLCLIEAYGLLHYDEYEYLRVLRRNSAVMTVEPSFDVEHADECPMIGNMARYAGRLGAGHAAYTAVVNAAGVMTSQADQLRAVLPEKWVIVEL